ncbi:hypothetical protein A2973_00110 [Candidatus Gottesmanbacteria bacterium RIFCSPLOWO2_01_FULL_49_10]|uniref:Ferric oxidoreductase domain-containing protein n=1 Tax=Candidatus Gottesmanbacteria bacterium RIFCSPLOWO2_01_FULL_49_10 TaxID=1798396 RepID=A0A1F6B154_9BACT|nr:MAG: hypothetical protein A2973_00110 [Candidatus Gottesmanbacteria bacterium RIFCSPLOWO2_01_FULL_49_10]
MREALRERVFRVAARAKTLVYHMFFAVYAVFILTLLVGSIALVGDLPWSGQMYGLGVWSGRAAVTILAAVLVPGILGRFGIQIKVTRVITFYRRQLGITTFLLAFTHGMLVRWVARIALGQYPLSAAPLFEFFGTFALSLLFFLFVTSNDTSVKRLGPWWKRLHRTVYIIVWLVLFHTLLQRVSVWSALIGVVAVLEVVSLLYSRI